MQESIYVLIVQIFTETSSFCFQMFRIMEVLKLWVFIFAIRFVEAKIKLDKILPNYNEKLSNWTAAAVWSDEHGDGFFNSSFHQFVDVDNYLVRKFCLQSLIS